MKQFCVPIGRSDHLSSSEMKMTRRSITTAANTSSTSSSVRRRNSVWKSTCSSQESAGRVKLMTWEQMRRGEMMWDWWREWREPYLCSRLGDEAFDLEGASGRWQRRFSQTLHEGIDHGLGDLTSLLHLIKNLQTHTFTICFLWNLHDKIWQQEFSGFAQRRVTIAQHLTSLQWKNLLQTSTWDQIILYQSQSVYVCAVPV